MAYLADYDTQHDAIWAEYKEKYKPVYTNSTLGERSTLIIDGAVNPEKYKGILFLLKEAYTDEKEKPETWDICSWLNENVHYSLWNRVAEWTYGICNTTSDAIPRYSELTQPEKLAAIQSIGLVNIKKVRGKKHSENADLLSYAKENKALLRREIESLQPCVIVCGYTGSYLGEIFDCSYNKGKNRSDNLYYHIDLSPALKSVTVLDYYHPAAPYPAIMSYYGITGIYQQSLKDV